MGILAALLDLVYPPRCMFCKKLLRRGAICENCAQTLPEDTAPRMGTFFTVCYGALCYTGVVRDAVIRFKFHDQPGYATEFGKILAGTIRANLRNRYDLITWIPVSQTRRKQRGYDQAMLLAMAAALALEDVAVETLCKPADNPAQSSLQGAAARHSNVLGAYAVTEPELVRGKRILLVDDIVTTGATLEEASRMLLGAGATEVVAAVLAQTEEKMIPARLKDD